VNRPDKPTGALAALLEDDDVSPEVPRGPSPEEYKHLQRCYLAVGATAILMFASFHPLDLGPLIFVAMVPLLYQAARVRLRVAAVMSYAATFLYHLVGLSWIAVVSPEGWLTTCFIEGLYGAALVCGPLWVRRRTGLPLLSVLPFLGAALEMIRGNFPFIAFPWLFFGHALHDQTNLIQLADVTSTYGLTFIVLGINAAIVDIGLLVRTRLEAEHDLSAADVSRLRYYVIVPLVCLLLAWVYGSFKRGYVGEKSQDGPRLLVVQTNIPQNLKDDAQHPSAVARQNLDLTRRAMARATSDVDGILWSETMWPWPLPDKRTEASREAWEQWLTWVEDRSAEARSNYATIMKSNLRQLFDMPATYGAPLMVGAMDTYWSEDTGAPDLGEHNSYYLLEPDLREGAAVTARYDKIMLVPASEYIPGKGGAFDWFFQLIKSFVPKGFKVFERGPGPVLMDANGWQLAPSICFEISFAELHRQSTLAGADVHVCPANDAWFVRGSRDDPQGTAEIPLALDHARFRAIESRRGVVRCVNRGISCVIDPTGEVVESGLVEQTVDGAKQQIGVEGTLLKSVPTTELVTFYTRYGNVFPTVCGLVFLLLAGLSKFGAGPLMPIFPDLPPEEPDAAEPEPDSDSESEAGEPEPDLAEPETDEPSQPEQ
jgi:apolipoprotein N-acyltransferase